MTDSTPPPTLETPERPPTIDRAYWAAVVWAVFSVISALDLWMHRSYVQKSILDSNKKAKNPRTDLVLGSEKLHHTVTQSLIYSTVQAVLLSAVIVLAAMQLRRNRSWSRWVLLILAVIPILGTGVIVQLVGGITVHAPGDYKALSVVGGLFALALIVLLLMPATMRYFAALRSVRMAEGPEDAAPRRPGLLGGLFTPRGPVAGPREKAPPKIIDAEETGTADEPVTETVAEPAGPARPRTGAKPKTATGTPRTKSRRR